MDKQIWRNPIQAKELNESQTPLWFWNDKLEEKELVRQLELKSQTGVTCTTPHARTNGGEGYIGGYLDEDWMDKTRTVLEYKKAHQEPVWLYDEIDWPAGTCNQTITLDEKNREQYLTIEEIKIAPGEVFRIQLKELTGKGTYKITPEDNMENYAFNVTVIDAETKKAYHTPDYFVYCMFGPEFEFQSNRSAIAYVISIHAELYEYGGNGQVSYLNAEATKQFLASTYDKYYDTFSEYFGNTITCVFNDETRMAHALAWSREFAREFEKRKGYSLLPHLYQLVRPETEAGRIRCDYFDVLASLYQENYFGVLQNWCHDHGIRFFAHLLGEETMFGHARYSGDYLRQNQNMDIAGADHLGKGIGSLNIKYTACGAHSYGIKRTGVEVFAGCGWDLTFEEYIRMITWMFQQGMQIIINHGFFYSDRGERKNDWPPSQFFQWKGWDRMKEGNAMIRRLHYAFTDGINEADVLVYHPIESFWLHYLPDQHFTHGFFRGAFLHDEQAAGIDREMQLLLNGLISENLDFDLLHKEAASNFQVRGTAIENILTGQKFSSLILPMCEILPIEVARLCEEYVDAGGTVLVIEHVPTMAMRSDEDQELQDIFRRLEEKKGLEKFKMEAKDDIYHAVRKYIPMPVKIVSGKKGTVNNHPVYDSYLIDPYVHTGEDISGVMFTRYQKNGKRNTLFMNYGQEPETIRVQLPYREEEPEVWDTFTGTIVPADILTKGEGVCEVRLTLPCNYGMLVVTEL